HVQSVAESLHILRLCRLRKNVLGFGQRLDLDLQTCDSHFGAELGWRIDVINLSPLHECHTMAAFGFVKIRSGNYNGHAAGCERGECIPEVPSRHRINARGWFVKEKQFRI